MMDRREFLRGFGDVLGLFGLAGLVEAESASQSVESVPAKRRISDRYMLVDPTEGPLLTALGYDAGDTDMEIHYTFYNL